MSPSAGQLILLFIAIAHFAAGGAASALRLRIDSAKLRKISRICMGTGLLCAIGVLAWHSAMRGDWLPLSDNFDALVWLGALLATLVLYMQHSRPLPGLDWLIMPIVVLLLTAAGVFGIWEARNYQWAVRGAWWWVHSVSTFGGVIIFAVSAATGALYVIVSRRLRAKRPDLGVAGSDGPALGSLERLEHLTMLCVTLGFALLSIGVITGFVISMGQGQKFPMFKFLLAASAWLVYALVLHAPINPRFRGRRAAMLSIVGFLLMIGAVVSLQFVPGGGT